MNNLPLTFSRTSRRRFLRAAGVHSMQGYRFGKPGPASELTQRLATPEAFPGRQRLVGVVNCFPVASRPGRRTNFTAPR